MTVAFVKRLRFNTTLFVLGLLATLLVVFRTYSADLLEPLAWDAETKESILKTNETHGHLVFYVTNVSPKEVIIEDVKTSCGCTVVTLPSKPWKLAPKESGGIEIAVDMRGKSGTLTKTVGIVSPTAPKTLTVKATVPQGLGGGMTAAQGDRLRNQEAAAVDRQAVFRKDCAKCHMVPTFGKHGQQLYQAACGICHDSPHRATMVPDLHSLDKETDLEYWKQWIKHGKEGTLMPAFAMSEGGPLDEEQVNSLADYMLTLPKWVKKSPSKPTAKKE